MGARPAARVDRDCVHNLSVNSCLKTAKSDVGSLMVTASRRTTGPMNRERIQAGAHFLVQSFGERYCPALCFDESQVAIIRSDARDQSAHKWRGAGGGLRNQRPFQEFGHPSPRKIGNGEVLTCC